MTENAEIKHEPRGAVPDRRVARANLMKAIGPGILVACAAVGGSHLVWSTRAGAIYGWSLIGLILLANLFKFPFFLYGQRYTAATGESLLAGYRRHGMRYVVIFLLINILTATVNIAGVGMLSGALLAGFGIPDLTLALTANISISTTQAVTLGILLVCALMVLLGHYKLLDGLAKVVIIVLALTTFAAVGLALGKGGVAAPGFEGPSPWTWAAFPFLVMLLGWMPAPVDLSAWSSLWMFSRERQTGHFATVRETQFDFYLGYVMAVVLAVVFLALGKLVMFGSGEEFSSSGIAFSNQFVALYSSSIGEWARLLILTAAFVTMFSTTLTCVDGYPRALAACCTLIGDIPAARFRRVHYFWVMVSCVVAGLILIFFVQNLLQLLSFAAVVSFLTSPVIAFINLKVMTGPNVPAAERPGAGLRLLSWAGLAFFVLMAAGLVYVRYFAG